VAVELVPITTRGDVQQVGPIAAIGQTGVFTKELQRALLDETIDVAVHSLKDLPTDVVPGLVLAATPARGPVGDLLVTVDGRPLQELPPGARVGTGSQRRRALLRSIRADLELVDIRGNVDTRLRKLLDGEYQAIVLAEAGLHRLGLAAGRTWRLPIELVPPAPGQAALGIEARASDPATLGTLAALDHGPTRRAVVAERSLLAHLRAGCLAPVAAWGRDEDDEFVLTGVVASPDGTQRLEVEARRPVPVEEAIEAAVELGRSVAEELTAQGAGSLIEAARRS
jgi:hydroxymethylbilane synthase